MVKFLYQFNSEHPQSIVHSGKFKLLFSLANSKICRNRKGKGKEIHPTKRMNSILRSVISILPQGI